MKHTSRPTPRQQLLAGFDTLPADPPPAAPVTSVQQPAATAADDSPPTVEPAATGDATTAGIEFSSAAASETPPQNVPITVGPPDLTGQRVYVVDAHSLIYQVFHALPEMTSPMGQPVAAVHGFIRDLIDLLEKRKPDFLLCAFDHPGDTFRQELYAEYKANRASMPDDLRTQIPIIHRMLEAMAIPSLSIPHFEADDILATVARQVENAGGECVLVTGDKDCRQLISDQVRLLNIRKNEFFDAAALQTTWGVRPDQVVDFQALVGDPVDHIPGVPLIGPKLAQELLQKYDSLDNLLEHADEVAGTKRRENLLRGREQVLVSRQLVRLRDDVPVAIDWEAGRVGRFHYDQVQALCDELGFRRLADRLAAFAPSSGAPSGPSAAATPATTDVPADPSGFRAAYRTVANSADLAELAQWLRGRQPIAIDTETTSTRPRWAELVGVSLAWAPGDACYIPIRVPAGQPQLPWEQVREALRPILEDPTIAKVGQNLKYDLIVLRQAGLNVQGVAFDSMVADYLLEPGERIHNLDDLARRYLRHRTIRIEELIGTGRAQKRMDEVPVALITAYAAEDADVPLRLMALLRRRLDDEGLGSLFDELEMPLVEVLAELEFNGISVDVSVLERLSKQYGDRLAALEAEIHTLAGKEFNIDSPSQVAEILFDRLQLPVIKRTKTGSSTDAEVLEELATLHPLPAKMLEYRQLAKLRGTYVEALPALIHPLTGRIHSSFKQDVAATGRLSSTDPNLQNIPIRTEAGREIRAAFRAGEPGWQLLAADYSQIELRVLAHFSGDEALQRAFANDEDIHTRVASQVYGVDAAQVTRDMRRSAKAINFGVLYGQSPFGLAKSLGISQEDAGRFIDAYFAGYPGVDAFLEKVLADATQKGYVTTILGRRRAVQGVRDPSQRGASRQRNLPERIAINTVIQGSAADLIKRAMINIHRRLRQEPWPARMLLQIHDELVFEVAPEACSRLTDMVVAEMTGASPLAVPLKVDVATGTTWADCE